MPTVTSCHFRRLILGDTVRSCHTLRHRDSHYILLEQWLAGSTSLSCAAPECGGSDSVVAFWATDDVSQSDGGLRDRVDHRRRWPADDAVPLALISSLLSRRPRHPSRLSAPPQLWRTVPRPTLSSANQVWQECRRHSNLVGRAWYNRSRRLGRSDESSWSCLVA